MAQLENTQLPSQQIVPEIPFTASEWKEMMDTFQPGPGDAISSRRSTASLVGYIDPLKTRSFIRYALGYSFSQDTSPYHLIRFNPGRHPDMPWLFVDSIQFNDQAPIGNSAKANNAAQLDAVGSITGSNTRFPYYGKYGKCQATVNFIQYPYNFYDEGNEYFVQTLEHKEFYRNCEKFRSTEPQLDVLQAETDRFLVFTQGPVAGKTFPGSIAEYVMKTGFVLKWYQVPEDFVMLDSRPTKLLSCIGKVNDDEFLGFPAGTLLCQAPKFTRYQQPVWTTDEQGIYAYDIEIPFQYFDPPSSGSGSGAGNRGHNLFPYARAGGAGGGPAWYPVRRGSTSGEPYLPSADFETMFTSVYA